MSSSFPFKRRSLGFTTPSLAPWKRQSSLSCSAQPLAPAVTDTGHLPLHRASCRGTWAHSGISYLAFGWLFFAAASLAFTGSGSLAGMGEFYRIERTPKKDITDFFVKEQQHDGADRTTCWDAPEWCSAWMSTRAKGSQPKVDPSSLSPTREAAYQRAQGSPVRCTPSPPLSNFWTLHSLPHS